MALRFSGRSIVIVAIAPSTSYRIGSAIVVAPRAKCAAPARMTGNGIVHLRRMDPRCSEKSAFERQLREFVEFLWYAEQRRPERSRERLLPDAAVDLIVSLTDNPFGPPGNALVSGPHSTPVVIAASRPLHTTERAHADSSRASHGAQRCRCGPHAP
jgi:hypothetical protein